MVRRLLAALFVSIAIWGGWILGQGEESGRDAEIEQLKSRVSELEGDESIPEATRNSEVSSLQQAIAFLEKASEFEAKEGEYKEALAKFDPNSTIKRVLFKDKLRKNGENTVQRVALSLIARYHYNQNDGDDEKEKEEHMDLEEEPPLKRRKRYHTRHSMAKLII